MNWYFVRNDEQRGPVSDGQLRQMAAAGELRLDDLVWRDGLPKWVPALRVTRLFSSPPPLPVTEPAIQTNDELPSVNQSATRCGRSRRRLWVPRWLLVGLGTVVTLVVLVAVFSGEELSGTWVMHRNRNGRLGESIGQIHFKEGRWIIGGNVLDSDPVCPASQTYEFADRRIILYRRSEIIEVWNVREWHSNELVLYPSLPHSTVGVILVRHGYFGKTPSTKSVKENDQRQRAQSTIRSISSKVS